MTSLNHLLYKSSNILSLVLATGGGGDGGGEKDSPKRREKDKRKLSPQVLTRGFFSGASFSCRSYFFLFLKGGGAKAQR